MSIFKNLVSFLVTSHYCQLLQRHRAVGFDLDIIYKETHSNLQALVVLWLLWLLLEVAGVDLGTIVSP